MRQASNQGDSHEWFLTTHWSIVLTARDADDSKADVALADLCQSYWRPLYAFLRRSGYSPDDAQDLTQSFFAKLIGKDYLKSVDQGRGRFRSFLLASIKHFASNQRKYDRAIKRGGQHHHLSIDYDSGEAWYCLSASDQHSPDYEFEYRWALTVLEQALATVREQYRKSGKLAKFDQLKPFLVAGEDQPTYQQVGERLGLGENGVRSAVHRLRNRYRQSLRQHVAQTVGSKDDIDDELRQLIVVLAKN